jgi:hypothetical protein
MSKYEYVVYKDHDGFYSVAHDYWFDDPTYMIDGERMDVREEVGRFKDMHMAVELRHTYNQMVHRRQRLGQ